MRRAAWSVVALVVLVGALFLFVFPTRTYLAQRRSLHAARDRVHVLSVQNRELAARVKKLDTDDEIERIAREQYDLVRPGEEAYAILPAPQPVPAPAPDHAPPAKHKSRGLLATIRNWLP
jgi:cell division protein FtsB